MDESQSFTMSTEDADNYADAVINEFKKFAKSEDVNFPLMTLAMQGLVAHSEIWYCMSNDRYKAINAILDWVQLSKIQAEKGKANDAIQPFIHG